jgi:YidC/Oxa1 family membrane protein insertase
MSIFTSLFSSLFAASGSTSTTLGPTATTVAHKSSGLSLDPIAKPIAEVLAGIYSVVPNYGVAIIVLSVIWMVIISPLTLKSTRSMLAMQKLQPQLKKLQEKHKDDKQAFVQAQMDLFREHNVSPFGSCWPLILPMPVYFALFRVIDGLSHTVHGVASPRYLSPHTEMYKAIRAAHGHLNAFGMNLANNAFSHHSSFAAALPFFVVLLVQAATSYFMQVQVMSRNKAAYQQNPQMAAQARMMKFIPLVFVLVSLRFPAGVVVYYTMSNICRIVQQDLMYRFDPKVKALVAKEVIEVEAFAEVESRGVQLATASNGADGGGMLGGASPGRSRFRDLLARAAEQQRTRAAQQETSSGSGRGATSLPSRARAAQSSANPRSGNPANGSNRANNPQAGRRKAQAPRGHRTNRKRRRR